MGRSANMGRIYYASTSHRLASDVSRLLLRFGVLSRLKRTSSKAGHRDCWQLHITGVENQRAFLQHVGVHGARGAKAEIVEAQLIGVTANTNLDTVPKKVWAQVRTLLAAREMTHREFAAAMAPASADPRCGSTRRAAPGWPAPP